LADNLVKKRKVLVGLHNYPIKQYRSYIKVDIKSYYAYKIDNFKNYNPQFFLKIKKNQLLVQAY